MKPAQQSNITPCLRIPKLCLFCILKLPSLQLLLGRIYTLKIDPLSSFIALQDILRTDVNSKGFQLLHNCLYYINSYFSLLGPAEIKKYIAKLTTHSPQWQEEKDLKKAET